MGKLHYMLQVTLLSNSFSESSGISMITKKRISTKTNLQKLDTFAFIFFKDEVCNF